MTDDSRPPRLYDDDEVDAILSRATELGRQESRAVARTGGTSLADLQDIAREAGIDPGLIRRAAGELERGGVGLRGWEQVAGEATLLLHEIEVEGELPLDTFEEIVPILEAGAGVHGQPAVLGRTLTWRGEDSNTARALQVTVSVRDGRTTIRAEERLGQLAGGVFGGGVGGFGVGLGVGIGLPIGLEVLGSVAFATAFPIGFVGLSFLGARAVYRHIVGRRRRSLDRMMAQVEETVRRAVARAAVDSVDRPTELPRG